MEFLKWGSMRYLSILIVLPAVDGGWRVTSLEKHGVVLTQRRMCFYLNLLKVIITLNMDTYSLQKS